MPAPEFVAAVNALARQEGFLVLIDDVRCGFRLKLSGSARFYGYEADLSCFGKAMANGYPIAVATGRAELKAAAEKVYFTGTHFFSGVPSPLPSPRSAIRASGAMKMTGWAAS